MKCIDNPPNPWTRHDVEWLGEPPQATMQVFEERAKSILSKNDSPDVPFRWSVNPYRGCLHGCAYCYARPTHQYLDFGAGTDFERKIVAKINAPQLLRAAFRRPSWKGEAVTFSGVTDCYQPLEASYQLTRACLEACLDYENPVGIITKGSLIRRDVELLSKLNERAEAQVFVSIPFADDAARRALEPQASTIDQRFKTLRILADAGIPVGVAIAPVIPGLSDSAIAEILERGRDAGARHAFMTMLRLPAEVATVFETRLRDAYPDRADRVLNTIRDIRGGPLNDATFGQRFTGQGPRWQAIETMFKMHSRRLGYLAMTEPRLSHQGPKKKQLDLF